MLLTVLAGVDEHDPAASAAHGKIPRAYGPTSDAVLKGRRVGVLRQAMGFHPDVDAAFARAVDRIKEAGVTVIDVEIARYNEWNDAELEVLLYEFKDGVNQYLKASGSPHASLEGLIAFNKAHADTVMPFFGQELFERAQAKGSLSEAAYRKAREHAQRLARQEGLLAALDRARLDAIVAPSVSPAWLIDHVLGDHFVSAGYGMAAVAGTPSITVPVGDVGSLPLGLTIMGREYAEADIIALAYVIEQKIKARKPPQFKPTLGSR
jgi:amidase